MKSSTSLCKRVYPFIRDLRIFCLIDKILHHYDFKKPVCVLKIGVWSHYLSIHFKFLDDIKKILKNTTESLQIDNLLRDGLAARQEIMDSIRKMLE